MVLPLVSLVNSLGRRSAKSDVGSTLTLNSSSCSGVHSVQAIGALFVFDSSSVILSVPLSLRTQVLIYVGAFTIVVFYAIFRLQLVVSHTKRPCVNRVLSLISARGQNCETPKRITRQAIVDGIATTNNGILSAILMRYAG